MHKISYNACFPSQVNNNILSKAKLSLSGKFEVLFDFNETNLQK